MRIIGMIGAMSWESPALQCRFINEEIKRRLEGIITVEPDGIG